MAQLIAIAASQAGPAHSFITGEALRAAAERLGHRLALWVKSPLGDQGGWSETELAQAQACILASDLDLDSPAPTHAPVLRIDPTEVLADAEGAVEQVFNFRLVRGQCGFDSVGSVHRRHSAWKGGAARCAPSPRIQMLRRSEGTGGSGRGARWRPSGASSQAPCPYTNCAEFAVVLAPKPGVRANTTFVYLGDCKT